MLILVSKNLNLKETILLMCNGISEINEKCQVIFIQEIMHKAAYQAN
jgi:hypothetical protein